MANLNHASRRQMTDVKLDKGQEDCGHMENASPVVPRKHIKEEKKIT